MPTLESGYLACPQDEKMSGYSCMCLSFDLTEIFTGLMVSSVSMDVVSTVSLQATHKPLPLVNPHEIHLLHQRLRLN